MRRLERLLAQGLAITILRPVRRLHRDRSRSREASEIMGAGTPVVLRSGPRPRLSEEAILIMGGGDAAIGTGRTRTGIPPRA